jgi:hypothetical protein
MDSRAWCVVRGAWLVRWWTDAGSLIRRFHSRVSGASVTTQRASCATTHHAPRTAYLVALAAVSWSAEPVSTPDAATGWHFTVGKPAVYAYACTQQVSWESAGDKLAYTTSLRWRFVLQPTAVTAERADLTATILSVRAEHTGPGIQRVVDSSLPPESRGGDDPLLGHHLHLVNAVFTLVMDPRTGAVAQVDGGAAVAERVTKASPSLFAGQRSPLATQADNAYASATLAPLWSRMLAAPHVGTDSVALGAPFTGSVTQTWTGTAWTTKQPEVPVTVTWATTPAPITAALGDLSGSGTVEAADMPSFANGELHYTLRFDALTQPVDQRHVLTWSLRREGAVK